MFELHNFRVGCRVELHPGTDMWMRGARFGEVVKVGRKHLTVKLDRWPSPIRVAPANIDKIIT